MHTIVVSLIMTVVITASGVVLAEVPGADVNGVAEKVQGKDVSAVPIADKKEASRTQPPSRAKRDEAIQKQPSFSPRNAAFIVLVSLLYGRK